MTHRIVVLRGQRVIVDAELAALYGVETKRFNEAVKRNAEKFPADFMFQLTAEEFANLRSQFATSSLDGSDVGHGGRRYLPRVFTEHGALMANMIDGLTSSCTAFGCRSMHHPPTLDNRRRRECHSADVE